MSEKKQKSLTEDRRGRYLIVPGETIEKILWKVQRVASFNDFYNEFTPNGTITASEILKQSGIPEKYHKIIIRDHILKLFSDCDAEEYTTGCRLDIKGTYKENGKKRIIFDDTSLFVGDGCLDKTLSISAVADYVDHEQVMSFYTELNDAELIDTYLESMKKIFVPGIEFFPVTERIYNEGRAKQLVKHYSNLPKHN